MKIITKSNEIVIRKMEDSNDDYSLIAKWLTDKKVLEFVYGRTNPHYLSKAKRHFRPKLLGRRKITPCIFSYFGKEIGYLQFYPVIKAEDYELDDAVNVWAIDLWIGEPEYWNKGIGSTVLKLLINYLSSELAAIKIVIDPHINNNRAIRAYEKAGFKKIKILKKHEYHEGKKVDCWLMELALDKG